MAQYSKRRNSNRRRQGGNNNPNRSMDSQGPEVKIRGTAAQIYDKYQNLARDAASSGDRIRAESLLQHAEHYYRLMKLMQPEKFEKKDENDQADDNAEAQSEAKDNKSEKSSDKSSDNGSDDEQNTAAQNDGEDTKPKRRRRRRRQDEDNDGTSSGKGDGESSSKAAPELEQAAAE